MQSQRNSLLDSFDKKSIINPNYEIISILSKYVAYQTSISNQEIDRLFQSDDPMDLVIAARKAYQFGELHSSKLVYLLEHEFYEIRGYSAKSLGIIGYEPAIEKLIPLLEDEVEEVRFSTAEALGNFQSDEVITPLIKSLADHSRETRRLATLSLDKQDGDQLHNYIQSWLNSIEEADYAMETEDAILRIDVARGIMEACSVFDYNWVNEILEQGIHSHDLEMVRLAAISIGNSEAQTFVEDLLKLQNHEDDDLRLAVIYGLTKLDFDDKINTLNQHIEDSYEFIRETLAEYIPKTYFNDHSTKVIELYLDDEVPFVRSALARGLKSPLYLKYLKILIEDENSFVRKEAILSLSSLNSPLALEILEDHEEEDDLVAISLENGIEDLKNLLKS